MHRRPRRRDLLPENLRNFRWSTTRNNTGNGPADNTIKIGHQPRATIWNRSTLVRTEERLTSSENHRRHRSIIVISRIRIRTPSSFAHHRQSSSTEYRRHHPSTSVVIIRRIRDRAPSASSINPLLKQRHYSFTLALLLLCNAECVCRSRPPEVDCNIELFELLGLALDT